MCVCVCEVNYRLVRIWLDWLCLANSVAVRIEAFFFCFVRNKINFEMFGWSCRHTNQRMNELHVSFEILICRKAKKTSESGSSVRMESFRQMIAWMSIWTSQKKYLELNDRFYLLFKDFPCFRVNSVRRDTGFPVVFYMSALNPFPLLWQMQLLLRILSAQWKPSCLVDSFVLTLNSCHIWTVVFGLLAYSPSVVPVHHMKYNFIQYK